MSTHKPTGRPSTGPGAETAVDGRPFEEPFDRERRQANELAEDVERWIERDRRRIDKKAAYREFRPRYEALRRMAHETVGRSRDESAATRRAALHRHPIYRALPENERRTWDVLVDEWTETIRTGDMASVWRHIGEIADVQASSERLAEWSAPEEDYDAAADLAAIPRG